MRNASARENHPTREKATRGVSPFPAWGDFHARSRFARSTIPEEKWETTRSLINLYLTFKKYTIKFMRDPGLFEKTGTILCKQTSNEQNIMHRLDTLTFKFES